MELEKIVVANVKTRKFEAKRPSRRNLYPKRNSSVVFVTLLLSFSSSFLFSWLFDLYLLSHTERMLHLCHIMFPVWLRAFPFMHVVPVSCESFVYALRVGSLSFCFCLSSYLRVARVAFPSPCLRSCSVDVLVSLLNPLRQQKGTPSNVFIVNTALCARQAHVALQASFGWRTG